jgi:hypothetical protein
MFMKKLIALSVTACSLLLLATSCSKQHPSDFDNRQQPPPQIINATVSVTSPYTLNISTLGTVNISKQATHFATSQTGIDAKDGILVYKYIPESGFAGTDEVELTSTTTTYHNGGGGCRGGSGNTSSYTSAIIIKFTVTN